MMDWIEPIRFAGIFLLILLFSWVLSRAALALIQKNPGLASGTGFRVLFTLFFLVSFLDAHSSFLVFKHYGLYMEANPVPFYYFKVFGVLPGLFFRMTVINIFLYFLYKKVPHGLLGLMLFYPLVPIWNYWTVLRVL